MAALLFVVIGLSTIKPALAADLTVIVSGLRSNAGDVHLALYDRAETFPDSDGMRIEVQRPITDGRARTVFRNLTDGRYAVATYHDENGNDDFDQGFLGLPLEDYGFSNGATAFLGPPNFAAAAIPVNGDTTIRIDLGN